MELEKLGQSIDLNKLISELSEVVYSKLQENEMIKKYERQSALLEAIDKLGKNGKYVKDSIFSMRSEALFIEQEIQMYMVYVSAFSGVWNPTRLRETMEVKPFKTEERYKKKVSDILEHLDMKIRENKSKAIHAEAILNMYK